MAAADSCWLRPGTSYMSKAGGHAIGDFKDRLTALIHLLIIRDFMAVLVCIIDRIGNGRQSFILKNLQLNDDVEKICQIL